MQLHVMLLDSQTYPFLSWYLLAIQRRLPRAATCFNTLYLPQYSSKSVMQHRLEQACSAQLVFDEGESWAAAPSGWAAALPVQHADQRLLCMRVAAAGEKGYRISA